MSNYALSHSEEIAADFCRVLLDLFHTPLYYQGRRKLQHTRYLE